MKNVFTSLGFLMSFLVGLENGFAQLPSVVQLPSLHAFSYQGSVLVPDGGTTSLGGVMRSASGYNHRGWNRGYGSVNSTSNASVSVRIIDPAEMDRQILGGSPQEFLRNMRARELQLGQAEQQQRKTVGQQTHASVRAPLSRTEEGKALVRFARQEYREGRQSSSIQAYGMAINQLDGRLKTLAEAEFRRVFGTTAEQLLRLSSLSR